MADNLTTQSATPATVPSSSVIATDDVSGVHFQRVKLVDGTADSSVAIAGDATNGLDVDVTRVQGTVTVADGGGTLSVDDGGGSLTVDGTVAVSGSVAVAGPLTDAQLRATAVPVSGTFYQATQPVSGTVGIDSATNTVKIDGTTNTVKLDAGQITTLTPPAAITGFATLTAQTTGNTSLNNIDTKLPALSGGNVPVTLGSATVTVGSHDVTNTGTFKVQATPSVSTGFVRGASTATNGTAEVSLLTAAGVGIKNYITTISVVNTGTTSALITFKDGAGGSTLWTTIAPALGGSNITFPIPIATTANTAFVFASGTAVTSIYANAAGYTGA